MDAPVEGVLVARSIAGKSWHLRPADAAAVQMLAASAGLPEIVARMLTARGIAADEIERFLAPRLHDQLPDPSHLIDMDRAAERLARAVADGETIAIFGDYDVDGATSAALLQRFFAAVGGTVRVYVPDRVAEGYGPNGPALRRLAGEGATVVVTVDCGITAHEALAEGAAAGLAAIVIDHHGAGETLPPAFAVVNPNRRDERSPLKHVAAVGVAFLLAVAINRSLRTRGWFGERRPPDLLRLLDLVALGTVADVVPLTGLNRVFVTQGLKVANDRSNPGIAALAAVARLDGAITAYHLGFVLGPRVNAGGRVGRADLGARLLATDDPADAQQLAAQLDALNRERQEIEAAVLAHAEAQVAAAPDAPIAFAVGEGWHQGVIGIVASRLKERFGRPALVVAIENGIGKGSGRADNGFDLGAAILAAREAGLLINGGGHPRAAGFTVAAEQLDAFRAFMMEKAAHAVAGTVMEIDGTLALSAATPALIAMLERAGPFGAGHREPRFAFTGVRVAFADIVGTSHVRCTLADPSGAQLRAIAFRAAASPLGAMLLDRSGTALHVSGILRADEWQGQVRVQLQIEDAASAAR
jgi:single-stranded-DNA-specific exonuclease